MASKRECDFQRQNVVNTYISEPCNSAKYEYRKQGLHKRFTVTPWSVQGTPALCEVVQSYPPEEIQMRRKAEALLYKKNTTNVTRKQQFANVARSNRFNYDPTYHRSCPNPRRVIPRHSSASNVPGNGMLYFDPKVPFVDVKQQPAFATDELEYL
tara:strand:+ start:5 stop:469 length:465 start_codon:yes stop_codon:yes gene_type:complete